MGKVVGLYVSPRIGEPMQPQTAVRALAGKGLEGDRYATGQGSYSRIARQVARHVSLIGREAIEAANEELIWRGLAPFKPEETRRNIIIEGYDIYALLGQEFRIGDFACVGPIPPDRVKSLRQRPAKSGSRRHFRTAGGVRAEILTDGIIAIGDVLIA